MKKWLGIGAMGVALLVAGVWLIAAGIDRTLGQALGVIGVGLILVSVLVFPLAARWALFRTKGRAVLFGAGLLGRLIKILVVGLLVAAIVVAVLMGT